MTRKPRQSSHLGPPSSRGAAPLPEDVIAMLKAEVSKPGMSRATLRTRLVPPPSEPVFNRALRGLKVSKAFADACVEYVRQLRSEA